MLHGSKSWSFYPESMAMSGFPGERWNQCAKRLMAFRLSLQSPKTVWSVFWEADSVDQIFESWIGTQWVQRAVDF
jgi:hypothetical protein